MNLQSRVSLHTGHTMPVMALGTWKLTKDTADIVAEALEIGYPMVDTSRDYGTQSGVGQGIRQSGVERNQFYLIIKVEETDNAYEITKKNLSDVGLEYADLILIHRPPKTGVGEELWQGLIRARDEGMTRDIGVSNYSIDQIKELTDQSGELPTVNQVEWSPFGHELEMLEYCKENRIILQAYSPLTHGKRLGDKAIEDLAGKYGKSPGQLLIRWNLQLSTIPIVKANNRRHLHENLDVFDFEISSQDMKTLGNLNEYYSALGPKLSYVKK